MDVCLTKPSPGRAASASVGSFARRSSSTLQFPRRAFARRYRITSGPLAHAWLEQRTHNPLVPCSTHGRPTIKINELQVGCSYFSSIAILV
jgi:hypothetical protein